MDQNSNHPSLKELQNAFESLDKKLIKLAEKEVHWADLAQVYQELDNESRSNFVKTISPEVLANILPKLPSNYIEDFIEALPPESYKAFIQAIDDDDRVDLLQHTTELTRNLLLSFLESNDQKTAKKLLKYSEDSAGGRMTTQIGMLLADLTLEEAVEQLKDKSEQTETLARIFVVDKAKRILGKIRLRDLVFQERSKKIAEVISPVKHTILATEDQETAVMMMKKYDLLLLPVVDEKQRLLGVLTADDAMEIFEQESTEDLEKIAGLSGEASEKAYFHITVTSHFLRRFPWLLVLGLTGIISGYLILKFQSTLQSLFLLALYLPMVTAAGGNSGGQAATVIIRAMSLGEIKLNKISRVVIRELRLGLCLGFVLAAVISTTIFFIVPILALELPNSFSLAKFALAVSIALLTQVTFSTTIGAFLPLFAKSLRLDPAVVASPAITTLVDVSGVAIYFVIAQVILGI